jgi:hypothetical protein
LLFRAGLLRASTGGIRAYHRGEESRSGQTLALVNPALVNPALVNPAFSISFDLFSKRASLSPLAHLISYG